MGNPFKFRYTELALKTFSDVPSLPRRARLKIHYAMDPFWTRTPGIHTEKQFTFK